ncbi:acyltransferase [Conexibacter sp. DBS9H8]|uniref:acyltransferase family protein n=1 Tax=Conexibacter sp. DBS9H8 TaxID=2937801 RepID=UPI00200D159C|nr:acyltransferase [Conexibacter sp. DBS9H8]
MRTQALDPTPAVRDRIDPQRRVSSLDGLRGWAALFVVFNHVFNSALTWYNPPGIIKWPLWSWRWWIVQTPLHLIWAGPEMVIVFFVLSGYVLTLPGVVRGTDWFRLSYYPRRLVRLYLPAWAAIAFAAVLHAFPARVPQPGASIWLNSFAVPATVPNAVRTAVLVGPTASLTAFTTVLWSMRWEVIFSLLLPVFIGAALATRRQPLLAVLAGALCLYLTCQSIDTGDFGANCVRFLPIFLLGSLMAVHLSPRRSAADPGPVRTGAPPARRRAVSLLSTLVPIALCVGLLTIGYWTVNEDLGSTTGWLEAGTIAGACLAVWLSLENRLMVALLQTRVSQWLGRRSYSLYLIHQPIVISLAFAFHGQINVFALAALSLPPALIAADLLYRWVEAPTITLSRRVAVLCDRRLDALNVRLLARHVS